MDAALVGQLINLGAAGAVIIVVVIFNKNIRERDQQWRDFFTELNRATCADAAKRLELTETILELVKEIIRTLHEHDAKVDARIESASKKTIEGVKRENSTRHP